MSGTEVVATWLTLAIWTGIVFGIFYLGTKR